MANTAPTLTPTLDLTHSKEDEHKPRRFIGPLPENVFLQSASLSVSNSNKGVAGGKSGWFGMFGLGGPNTDSEDHHNAETASLKSAIQQHALQFFLGHGGKKEDWGEEMERKVREEMLEKWKESEWGRLSLKRLRNRRKDKSSSSSSSAFASINKKWIGDSYDVGVFLGIDVLRSPSLDDRNRSKDFLGPVGLGLGLGPALSTASNSKLASTSGPSFVTSPLAPETFITAPSHLSTTPLHFPSSTSTIQPDRFPFQDLNNQTSREPGSSGPDGQVPPGPSSSRGVESGDTNRDSRGDTTDEESPPPGSADSSTALLPNSNQIFKPTTKLVTGIGEEAASRESTQPLSIPRIEVTAFGDTNVSGRMSSNVDLKAGVEDKVKGKRKAVHYAEEDAPSKVLARTGSQVQDTSAGAAQQATVENQIHWGDVIMRDRMLVRVSYTEAENLGVHFDEAQNRVTSNIQDKNWAEYIVAWRKDKVELYKNHSTPGKSWFTGRKHLAFVIPLNSSSTRLSVYSFVDMTFCFTCPPASLDSQAKSTRWFGSRRGTNIFVFKVKSRSRAVDWIWNLWRHLGGTLPPFIEIRAPALDTRMKIDIPNYDIADINSAYSVFTHSNVTKLCQEGLETVPEYENLIERYLRAGSTLELAWRIDTVLDWVWQLNDVKGKYRDWAVLCGLALKQGTKPCHLELRLKQHNPTRFHLRDGTRLDEPPAIEGYLERIRPNTQLKQSVYLSTHDGYIFALSPTHANPPMSPGPPCEGQTSQSLRDAEIRRGTRQIMLATGMSDLRSIVAVRRAFQVVPIAMEQPLRKDRRNWEDEEQFWTVVERHDSDLEDQGGEEGLIKATVDRPVMRMRRSFELLLTSGRVIRFEAYSCLVALEWITRLRPLVSYWKKRHQVDAKNEMNLAYLGAGQSKLTPLKHLDEENRPPDAPPSLDISIPELSAFYNWCVLDDCRPILKCGRLFGRVGLRGQYKHIQLVLITGHLMQYHISGRSSMHHRRHRLINLLDAYVCSGHLAAQHLPSGQYNADRPPLARRYQDGLESDEREEDTLFTIWFRPNVSYNQVVNASTNNQVRTIAADLPPLSVKRRLAVFRTRSKLERDAWVWAINSEIEKVVRAAKEREDRVRELGEIVSPKL
ncbi:hypothetical protein ABKN59_004898 [Abortiporus biennis]